MEPCWPPFSAQDRPRSLQDPSKTPPRRPQPPPRRPKTAPGRPKTAPRRPQEAPKTTPRASQDPLPPGADGVPQFGSPRADGVPQFLVPRVDGVPQFLALRADQIPHLSMLNPFLQAVLASIQRKQKTRSLIAVAGTQLCCALDTLTSWSDKHVFVFVCLLLYAWFVVCLVYLCLENISVCLVNKSVCWGNALCA